VCVFNGELKATDECERLIKGEVMRRLGKMQTQVVKKLQEEEERNNGELVLLLGDAQSEWKFELKRGSNFQRKIFHEKV
jgi:hypothetical protein